MNKELGAQGIKSTALCPAFVDTPMTDFAKGQVKAEEMIRPEDIAEAVRYLLKTSPGVRRPGDHVHAARRRALAIRARARERRLRDRSREPPVATLGEPLASGDRAPRAQAARADLTARIGLLGGTAALEQRAVLGDRARKLRRGILEQARLQVRDQHAKLAPARAARTAPGTGEAVPGVREREEIGAPAAAVRREHRADAAFAVDVRADDDRLPLRDARQHRFAGVRPAGSRSRSADPLSAGRGRCGHGGGAVA